MRRNGDPPVSGDMRVWGPSVIYGDGIYTIWKDDSRFMYKHSTETIFAPNDQPYRNEGGSVEANNTVVTVDFKHPTDHIRIYMLLCAFSGATAQAVVFFSKAGDIIMARCFGSIMCGPWSKIGDSFVFPRVVMHDGWVVN